MKKIPLTQGLFALVDDQDYEELSKYKWHASKNKHTFYAQGWIRVDGAARLVKMHRILMGSGVNGFIVDHRDGDGLNNRRANLRACSNTENMRNQRLKKNNTTGFKGVSIAKGCVLNPYKAQIRTNGTRKHIGCYPTPELAYAAYCAAAIELHGEFARLA